MIRFGLQGHTHNESFRLANSMTNPSKPVVLHTVAASTTTYELHNPSFKVLELDRDTLLPVNMYSHALDLDEANATGTATWREIHDYKTTYQMADLRPSNFKDLAYRIFHD